MDGSESLYEILKQSANMAGLVSYSTEHDFIYVEDTVKSGPRMSYS